MSPVCVKKREVFARRRLTLTIRRSTDADKFPYDVPFYPDAFILPNIGEDTDYNRTYYYAPTNAVDCCDYAMSSGLAAFGVWYEGGIFGRQLDGTVEPLCLVYNVRNKTACDTRKPYLGILDNAIANLTGLAPPTGTVLAL